MVSCFFLRSRSQSVLCVNELFFFLCCCLLLVQLNDVKTCSCNFKRKLRRRKNCLRSWILTWIKIMAIFILGFDALRRLRVTQTVKLQLSFLIWDVNLLRNLWWSKLLHEEVFGSREFKDSQQYLPLKLRIILGTLSVSTNVYKASCLNNLCLESFHMDLDFSWPTIEHFNSNIKPKFF